MKQFILTLSILFAIFNQAQARSIAVSNTLTANLESFDMNHDHLSNVNLGHVSINLDENTISLVLTEKFDCFEICAAVAPLVHRVTLDIISIEDRGCSGVVYTASNDDDETLVVTDYSMVMCTIFIPYATTVSYTSFFRFETTSEMGGQQLRNRFFPEPIPFPNPVVPFN